MVPKVVALIGVGVVTGAVIGMVLITVIGAVV
jgi:hypothetical protein